MALHDLLESGAAFSKRVGEWQASFAFDVNLSCLDQAKDSHIVPRNVPAGAVPAKTSHSG